MTDPLPATNPLGTEAFYWNVEYPLCRRSVRIEYRSDSPSAHASYRFRVRPWITHDGGPCPVGPFVRVRVRSRDGVIAPTEIADWWWWGRDEKDEDREIIAYQIIEG